MSKQKRLRALEQHPHSSVLDWCVFNRYVFVFKHTQMLYREMYTLMLLAEKTMLALIDQWHTKEQKTTKHTHSTIHPQTEVSLNKRTTHLAKTSKAKTSVSLMLWSSFPCFHLRLACCFGCCSRFQCVLTHFYLISLV